MYARVVIDSPLPHLDRAFDYVVPDALSTIEAGTRVRVPFAGRLVSGLVLEVVDGESPHAVKPLKSAGGIPSLTPEGIALASSIASRYGGGMWDVIRLMAPPRVASVERLSWGQWRRSSPGGEPVERLISEAVRAGLPNGPGERGVWAATHAGRRALPADALLGAALAAIRDGGSALLVVPDSRSVHVVLDAARAAGMRRWTARSGGDVALLDADDGPQVRYGNYIAAMRGIAPLVIGTRQAAWQPVPELRHISVWDEASTTMQEPRAPYPHARTVAAMRAQESGCSLLIAGHVLSADSVALVDHGFAKRVDAACARDSLPAMSVLGAERRESEGGSGKHWMPTQAWVPLMAAARDSVGAIVVPQAGYAAGLACMQCGTWAECEACGGDLAATGPQATPACRDCGVAAPHWHCPECRGYRVRPVGLGVTRLSSQVRRMAPDVAVTVSAAHEGVVTDGVTDSGIVIATPGALPAVAGGYQHLVIAGARVNVGEGLGAEVAAARRWLNAAALVRGRAHQGAVQVVGDLPDAVRAALAAWDGWSLGAEDLRQRTELGLPPHRRAVRLDGSPDAIDEALSSFPRGEADVSSDAEGAWVLASRGRMQAIVDALRAVVVRRSAASMSPLYMRVDAVPGQG